MELNTEMANMYPCQALPGSPLHTKARREGRKLPDSYAGYAFLSYDSEPLPTDELTAAEVLAFRDHAWQTYSRTLSTLRLVESRFGPQQRENVEAMAQVKLHRRLLGHTPPEISVPSTRAVSLPREKSSAGCDESLEQPAEC